MPPLPRTANLVTQIVAGGSAHAIGQDFKPPEMLFQTTLPVLPSTAISLAVEPAGAMKMTFVRSSVTFGGTPWVTSDADAG